MGGDATGWKRGEKGFAAEHKGDLKPDADLAKLYGPKSDGGADGGLDPANGGKGFKGIKS